MMRATCITVFLAALQFAAPQLAQCEPRTFILVGVAKTSPLQKTNRIFDNFENEYPLNYFAAGMKITDSISYGLSYWDYGKRNVGQVATVSDSISGLPMTVFLDAEERLSLIAATLRYRRQFGAVGLDFGVGAGLYNRDREWKYWDTDQNGRKTNEHAITDNKAEQARIAFGGADLRISERLYVGLNLQYEYNASAKWDYFEKDIYIKFGF